MYFPNTAHIPFCRKIVDELKWFAEGCIILGGDFNVPLYPQKDTSTGHTTVTYRTLRRLKILLNSLSLVDTWRLTHTTERDYTFFSSPHKQYSQIDLIFVSQRDLSNLETAEIGIVSLSDHAPTAISMRLDSPKQTTFNWRLNASLLTDKRVKDEIQDTLTEYFRNNLDADTNPMTNWEAHKSVLRGHLMKWGSRIKRKKRERNFQLDLANSKIRNITRTITLNFSRRRTDPMQELP